MSDNNFFNIRIGTLQAEAPLPFDLFVQIGGKQVHYLRQGDQLSKEKIQKFDSSQQFHVPMDQRPAYKNFIHDRISEDGLDVKTKAHILRESSLSLVEELYENPDVSNALDESKRIIGHFIDFIDKEPEGMSNLISLSSHDFYTYNHSLDVGVYCLGLARIVGYSNEELTEMGRGALFHDIGKKWVDVDIICKDGPLDDVEWAQMKKHPEFGLQILAELDVSDAIKACCYEHHESFLGNGYPQALPGPEIHHMARIVAISDTYDAMTTQRSYNKPMTPNDAVEMISNKLKDRYDPDLLKALREVMFAK